MSAEVEAAQLLAELGGRVDGLAHQLEALLHPRPGDALGTPNPFFINPAGVTEKEGGEGGTGKADGSLHVHGELNLPGGAPGVLKKLAPAVVDWDTSAWWDPVGHRFVPQKPGIYLVSVAFEGFESVAAGKWTDVAAARNGVLLGDVFSRQMSSSGEAGPEGGCTGLVKMNGTTDALEIWGGALMAALKGEAFLAIAYLGHE